MYNAALRNKIFAAKTLRLVQCFDGESALFFIRV